MHAFTVHTGIAAPLRRSNIDTDQICASEFLKRITKTGYDDALFAEWRQEPDFILNQPAYAETSILVTGPSFGTGSSREHAVWALRDYGIQVVISSSFGDIFRGNSGKQGLLLATLTEAEVSALWEYLGDRPGASLTVNLRDQTVTCGDLSFRFTIDSHTKHRLLNGLDDIGLTLQHEADITAFEASRPHWKPRISTEA